MGCASSVPDITNDDKLSHTYKRARLAQNLVQQTNKVDPLSRYEILSKIGVGSIGHVCTVRRKGSHHHHHHNNDDNDHTSSHLYAMKTLRAGRLTREFIAELRNEIRSVRRLDHANIVRFHEVYYQTSQISIIMDYCSGGDLYGRMPYTERQAASIMKQVLEALAYMHGRGYVHLDIKVCIHKSRHVLIEDVTFLGASP
jgi:serine/threonine protein kinase